MKKRLLILIGIPALILIWAGTLICDSRLEKGAPQRPGGPAFYNALFEGQALKVLSLGYEHALSDYYFMKMIQYVMETSDRDLPMDNLYPIVDVITTLNPRFTFAYEMSWIFMLSMDVRPMDVQIEEGEKILRKGLNNNPNDWRLAQYLAFHLFYYEKKYIEAADVYDKAFQLRKPPYILFSQLASRLRSSGGDPELALIGLQMQLKTTDDPKIQDKIKRQMLNVEAEIIAAKIDKVIEKYKTDMNIPCPDSLDALVANKYLRNIPPDGLGGTYVLDKEKCRASSTTTGRLDVFYQADKKKSEKKPPSNTKPNPSKETVIPF